MGDVGTVLLLIDEIISRVKALRGIGEIKTRLVRTLILVQPHLEKIKGESKNVVDRNEMESFERQMEEMRVVLNKLKEKFDRFRGGKSIRLAFQNFMLSKRLYSELKDLEIRLILCLVSLSTLGIAGAFQNIKKIEKELKGIQNEAEHDNGFEDIDDEDTLATVLGATKKDVKTLAKEMKKTVNDVITMANIKPNDNNFEGTVMLIEEESINDLSNIDWDKVEIDYGDVLGEGGSAIVLGGQYKGKPVAIKQAHPKRRGAGYAIGNVIIVSPSFFMLKFKKLLVVHHRMIFMV